MHAPTPHGLCFGVFELRPHSGELFRNGRRIKLAPQAVHLLTVLANHPGQLLTREEIQQEIWGDDAIVDFEHGINKSVRQIRRVLGDNAEHPKFIETLPRRGYRFIADVSPIDDAPSQPLRRSVALFAEPRASVPVQPISGALALVSSSLEHHTEKEAPQQNRARGHRLYLRWWAIAAAALLVAASGWWFLHPWRKNEQPVPKTVPLTSYPGNEGSPSFSPDGTQVAFYWNGENGDNGDVYVKSVAPGGKPLRLTTNPADDNYPAWSPDGKFIAFLRDLGNGKFSLFLIPALGGQERKLADIVLPFMWIPAPYIAWLPDGKSVVIPKQDSPGKPVALFHLQIETGEMHKITDPPTGSPGDSAPAVSADGSLLVFERMGGVGVEDLYELPLQTGARPVGEPKRITFDDASVAGVTWDAAGKSIIFSSNRGGKFELWRLPVPRFGGNPGKPIRMDGIAAAAYSPVVSTQRHLLAYAVGTSGDTDLWRVAVPDWEKATSAGVPARFISSTHDEFAAQYSPDGARIVFQSDRSGSYEIWTCMSDGSSCDPMSSFGSPVTGLPHWSPDGQRISFYSRVRGKAQIFVIKADGGAPRLLTHDQWDHMFSNWSRDGRWIYFSSNRTGRDEIWKMPAGGGPAVQITSGGGFSVSESPDGKWLYFTRAKEANTSLWRIPVGGGTETRVLDSVTLINYAVTNNGIYYMSPQRPYVKAQDALSGGSVIRFLKFADGRTRNILTLQSGVYAGLTVSPDERWLVYAERKPSGSDLMLVEGFE